MSRSRAVLACALLSLLAPAAASARRTPTYQVGIGVRSIAVDPDGTWGAEKVYLGGYGIGGPTAAGPGLGDRFATGNLGAGPSVRAFYVGRGRASFAIADIEVQGWFAATRDGPYGLVDMRREVAARTGGALRAQAVVVQSDHSHGGPDMMGVWGGSPLAYRRFVFEQTVDAIVDAWRSRERGTLWYGTAPADDLLANQFGYDPANAAMDSDVRVLQARDATGAPFATLLNFSAHATVLGSANRKATGDWVQAANPLLEAAFGGSAMTVVGTVGRTQPADRGCPDATLQGDQQSLCALDAYAGRVVSRARAAVAAARPLTGPAVVAARSYLIADPATNPLLLGLLYGGAGAGIPINRSLTPPFMAGNVIGTVTASARIGDVLLSAGPGEMYPQIPLKVREILERAGAARGFMTAGLANDQLGYLIAPLEAYPEPIRRSFFNERGDELSPIDNDNYFFNVSHTIGDRVTCSLLRGAGALFEVDARARYDRCAAFASDALLPAGSDVALGGEDPAGRQRDPARRTSST